MLAELRDQLRHDLETGSDGAATPVGVTVYPIWTEKVAAPCAIVGYEPGQIVGAGQLFSEWEVKLAVVLLVRRSATYVEDLEDLIERTLANVADWGMTGIDTPTVFTYNSQELLGTTIHLSKQSKL